MVVTDLPSTSETGMAQERTASPSIWTVQAPQAAMPQPNFVPVSFRCSRSTQSSGVSGATATSCRSPFTVMATIGHLPGHGRCGCARGAPTLLLFGFVGAGLMRKSLPDDRAIRVSHERPTITLESRATCRFVRLECADGSRPVLPNRGLIVPNQLKELMAEVALANRILGNEGVLDAFGHVSARHPTDPNRYLLSRARSPAMIQQEDILEFTLDSEPVKKPKAHLYAERVIHGCIYQARPDVMAVCHHHAPAIMPFAIAGKPIVPVFHVGAAIGEDMPFWDQHDEFGDTNLLVVKPEEGRSLARALGKHAAVLMNRHGATVVGGGLKELVARSIFMCQNAEYQMRALSLGAATPLHPGETRLAGAISAMPNVVSRTWEYWSLRLAASGAMPPRRGAKKATRGRDKARSKR